jgi:hypothetical protein
LSGFNVGEACVNKFPHSKMWTWEFGMHKEGMNLLGQSRSTGSTKNNIKLQTQKETVANSRAQ